MAYPSVSKSYGLKPVNRLDGLPYAGAIRQIPISAGYATAILNGDTVQIDANGYLAAQTTTDSGNSVGVLVGCAYTNSSGQPVEGQYYPAAASTSTALAYAYVVDDPNAIFRVVAVGSTTTTTPAAYSRAIVGSNVALATATGSTSTGDSYYGISGASSTTTALPIRVIDVVPDTATGPASASATTYYEFLVKINLHQYNSTTGI